MKLAAGRLLAFFDNFWLLLVINDGLKTWPRQFVTKWYHSYFDTSNSSGEEDMCKYGHGLLITAYRNQGYYHLGTCTTFSESLAELCLLGRPK